MRPPTIDDRKLLRLIDKDRKSQTEAAKELGVSRQAVSKRLQELRGKTTQAVVAQKIEAVVDKKLDAIEQLTKINDRANELLDQAEADSHLAIKIMAEIRGQLKLQIEIFETMYSLQAVQEFQETVLAAIGAASPEVRNEIISKLNSRRSIRQALRFS